MTSLAFAPQGGLLVTSSWANLKGSSELRLWSWPAGKARYALKLPFDAVVSLSEDGKELYAYGRYRGGLQRWRLE